MPIFVIFVFAAIVFGAGAMLAPAIPSYGPRIGLAGTLTLAFITSGAIFIAALFGWDTLVIDYMWFAAIVGIFFTGTLSAGMFRAEAEGGTRAYAGWPGPRELAFFLIVGIVFAAPALTFHAPLGTDAQGFGYLALTMRDSGSLTTLAPFHPEINFLYSPGFPALIAYLAERLNAGIHTIQFAVAAVLCVLFVWVAYDFGNELDSGDSRRTGLAMALCALIGTGLMTAYLDSHYTALLGLVFALAFLTFVIRFQREGRRADLLGAAITLAAMPLAQPDMTIILGLGYVPWLCTVWLANPRPRFRAFARRWLGLAVGIPLLAVLGVSPWIADIAPLLGSDITSPFTADVNHLLVMIVYHGVIIVPLAGIGIVLAIRRRNAVDLMMLVWLLLIVDFSSLGILRTLGGGLLAPITRYEYPFSIAWHGPIIPYLYFGGMGVLWLLERVRGGRAQAEQWIRTASLPMITGVAGLAVLAMTFYEPLLAFSKTTPLQMYGAFSSAADVQAMRWLQHNTPRDSLILNHPGPHEGDWAPVIAQRNTVYFRPQPFFQRTESAEAVQEALRAFWRDPTAPGQADLLAQYGISYVLVPQIISQPDALERMIRWRPPVPEAAGYGPLAPTPFLELVFDLDGAQVYRVIAP
jgi:hypothetical protein